MKCPSCGHHRNYVKDSRPHDNLIWRRRSCSLCSHRFTTYEFIDGERPKVNPEDHLTRVRRSLVVIEEVIRQYQRYKEIEKELDKTQPIKIKENSNGNV